MVGYMSSHINYDVSSSVSDAINTRRSLRAFLPKHVDRDTVEKILSIAARAPSGTNMQPWKTYVMTGETRQRLCKSVCAVFDERSGSHTSEVCYYPETWFEPYLGRRRQVGWALYNLLGIQKGDRERTHAQHRRNFQFFDAPVGMIFTIHRDLATGSWLDYGMFMENVMLLAREQGLHTCPQAAWADYHAAVRQVLPLGEDEIVVSGLALGYADPSAIENTLVTERVATSEHVRFLD
ncbi:MAG: nitroreductase [bacterium]|jgi:nitroreductase